MSRALLFAAVVAAFIGAFFGPVHAHAETTRGSFVVSAQVVDSCSFAIDGPAGGAQSDAPLATLRTSCASGLQESATVSQSGALDASARGPMLVQVTRAPYRAPASTIQGGAALSSAMVVTIAL